MRESLARQQGAVGPHPDADLLTAYSEGLATATERAGIEQHLALCPECREAIFLATGAQPPLEAAAPERAPARRRWFSVWVPWAAVAAMLVVGAVTFLPRNPALKEVAQARPASQMTDHIEAPPQEQTPSPSPEKSKTAAATSDQAKVGEATHAALQAKDLDAAGKREERADSDKFSNRKEVATANGSGLADLNGARQNSTAAAAPAPAPMARRQGGLAGGPSNQSINAQIANNNVQNTDALKAQNESSQQSSAVVGGNIASLEKKSVPPSSAQPAMAQAKPQAAPAPAPPASTSQTVAVTTEAAPIPTTGYTMRDATNLPMPKVTVSEARWRIASDGDVEHVADDRWTRLTNLPANQYSVVSLVAGRVWVGGSHDVLLLSLDQGQSWTQVALPAADDSVIRKIDFKDSRHGTVADSDGHTWSTSDGGATWTRKH